MQSIIFSPNEYKSSNRGIREESNYHLPYRQRVNKCNFFKGYPNNRKTLISIFSYLHNKSSHSVLAVRKKWDKAANRFTKNHLPYRGSLRFVNKFTAHSWM